MTRLASCAAAIVGAVLLMAGTAFAAGPVLGPLARTGLWITDQQGRVVVLHGVDIVKKVSPYYPSNFGPADAEFLANEGLTAARIGFIWAGAEPSPGVYDDTYIDHVLSFNDLLAKYGIRTLIDIHQDDYGTENLTPVEECSSDGVCDLGSGDGAPSWAMLGGGGGASYADQDFEDFWDNKPASNGLGIQTQFVALWAHLVSKIDASGAGNLLGLDPFNEPYPGSGYGGGCGDYDPCPAFEKTQLHTFYARVISAMRGAGYRGVIFPEAIADSGSAEPSLPGFADPQVAFNAHYYCTASQVLPDPTGVASESYCASGDASSFANYDAYAAKLNVPYIVSEFGSNDSDAEYAHETDVMGSRFLSWMYWMYYNYATDPGNFPTQGLLLDDNEPGSVSNTSPLKLQALVEPYGQAIAGTPKSYAFDRSTNTMTLTYTTQAVPGARLAHTAETQIFVPQLDYPTGYEVKVTGARSTSPPTSPWVELAANPGAQKVTVTITPRTGSSTELPSQAQFAPPAASGPRAGCPAPSGRLAGRTLGPITLGETRARVRHGLRRNDDHRAPYTDVFCFVPIGIRVGFPPSATAKRLNPRVRLATAGRVVLILTANRHYALHGVRPGFTVASAKRRLRLHRPIRTGLNTWYLIRMVGADGVLKVRRGVVEEVGIADPRLTTPRRLASLFLSRF